MYLSVPVPAGTTVSDLDACLRLFAEPEYLEETDRWYKKLGQGLADMGLQLIQAFSLAV